MDTEKHGGLRQDVTSGSDDKASGQVITSTQAEYGQTIRGLSPRHVQLMAIGGSIGTGLWVRIHPHILPQSDDTSYNTDQAGCPGAMTRKNSRK